jgi:hypothetical protein
VSEALRALAALVEPPCPEHAAIAEALGLPPPPSPEEHTEVLAFRVLPYASIYLGAEGMLGGEARDRVEGFWRALGGEPPHGADHVSVLCAALAGLAAEDTGADPRVRLARAALYREHVASWMPPFLAALRRTSSPFYVAWAETLGLVLAAEAEALGPAGALPLALRVAPPPVEAPADLDDLLASVLAPVRVGMAIVRDDLARCGAELGLAPRGGRRFALRVLLEQDPAGGAGVLGWLAAEARRQAEAYGAGSDVARWWQARALDGAGWLDRRARDAAGRGAGLAAPR